MPETGSACGLDRTQTLAKLSRASTAFVHCSFKTTLIYSEDEKKIRGPWEYFQHKSCDEQGLIVPGYEKARAIFVEDGGGAWTIINPKRGEVHFAEIFFPRGDIRFSASLVYYNDSGKCIRLSLLREDARHRPSKFWTTDVTMKDSSSLPSEGAYTGVETTLTSDLQQTVRENCQWDNQYWIQDDGMDRRNGNCLFYFPDNITISCPRNLYSHDNDKSEYHFSVCWLYKQGTETEIRQNTVFYGDEKFKTFKQGIYRPVS